MKTLLVAIVMLVLLARALAGQGPGRTQEGRAVAMLSVRAEVVSAQAPAFSFEKAEKMAGAQLTAGRFVVEDGRAGQLLIEVRKEPEPGRAAGEGELVTAAPVRLRPDGRGRGWAVVGAGVGAALRAAVREPGRYTVSVSYGD